MTAESIHTIGRRKSSVARIFMVPGNGKITVNGTDYSEYFKTENYRTILRNPLTATQTEDKFDIKASVKGGGTTGQTGAITLAIARALVKFDAEYKPVLKKEGLLTRDAREVERKKAGQPKARKKFQFRKR